MTAIATITLFSGGVVAWLAVGLVTGWLAARVMKGGGYGMVGDMIVGLIGAVGGGFTFELIVTGEASFWGSLLAAILAAGILIAVFRFLGFGRPGI